MLRREEKDIAIDQLRRLKNATDLLVSWSHGMLRGIARFFRTPETETNILFPNESAEEEIIRPPPPDRFIVFSDTDNDLESVKTTLHFVGILSPEDELVDDLEGITIVHTGDLTDKNNPDISVVEYWQNLQNAASKKGGHVRLIAGNHEQEIWLRIKAGKKYGIKDDNARKLSRFIESLDLFYVVGPVLFIHGYPTVEFLRALLHYKEITGRDLNRFNEDHYEKSLISVRAMKQYAYARASRKANHLLYDVMDPSSYYKKNGRLIGEILSQLEIGNVIHGHKPQRSGSQADYEFGKWIPNIRMIDNDTNVSRRGIGATVIRETSSGTFEIAFINSKNESDELRRRVCEILGERSEPATDKAVAVAQKQAS